MLGDDMDKKALELRRTAQVRSVRVCLFCPACAALFPDPHPPLAAAAAEMQVKAAEHAEKVLALKARRLHAAAPSAAVQAARAQLRETQRQVAAARAALAARHEECKAAQEQLRQLQEARKNRLVARADAQESAEKAAAALEARVRAETAKAQAAADAEAARATRELQEVAQNTGLLNRLTYCRLLTYQSSRVEVEAVLSERVRVQVVFTLSLDAATGKLSVDGSDVTLKQQAAAGAGAGAVDGESALAKAFFDEVLCSDAAGAPLSVQALAALESPADIPPALQRISGYTACLRRACTLLQGFAADGWSWAVGPSPSPAKGATVVATAPAAWGRSYQLALPLSALVSGDVAGLSAAALTVADGPDGPRVAVPGFVPRLHATLRSHAGMVDTVGAFPADLLRTTVEGVRTEAA